MSNLLDLETAIAGIYVALVSALDLERRSLANDMLIALADDSRTCAYASQLFRDIAESTEMAAPSWFDELESAVLH